MTAENHIPNVKAFQLSHNLKSYLVSKQYSIKSMMAKSPEIGKDPISEASNVNKIFIQEALELADNATKSLGKSIYYFKDESSEKKYDEYINSFDIDTRKSLGKSIYNFVSECSKENFDEYVNNLDVDLIHSCLGKIIDTIDDLQN